MSLKVEAILEVIQPNFHPDITPLTFSSLLNYKNYYKVISKKSYINKNYLYIEISIQQFHNLNIQIKLGRTGSLTPQTVFTYKHIQLYLNSE